MTPSSDLPCIAHAEGKGQDAATVREVCQSMTREVGNPPMTAAEKADPAATYDERHLECRNLQMEEAVCERVGAAGRAPLPVSGRALRSHREPQPTSTVTGWTWLTAKPFLSRS